MKILILILLPVLLSVNGNASQPSGDPFDKKKFYALSLDGNIRGALQMLADPTVSYSDEDLKIKTEFEKRFSKPYDASEYLLEKNSPIIDMIGIYHDYWRNSFLSNENLDSVLKSELSSFFNRKFVLGIKPGTQLSEDSLNTYVMEYVNDNGLKTTGFAKTGKFYDLLVWKSESDTVYEFDLNRKKIRPKVIFLSGFVTLGWEEYATLGKYYPGGWATEEALYCVKDAYDLNSESFLISYLAHEGQHFEDYKKFPGLSGFELEYRAKLVELAMAKETLYKLISFFINNGDYGSENPHSKANYVVIRNLSRETFKKEFESDITKWEEVPVWFINKESAELLEKNSDELRFSR